MEEFPDPSLPAYCTVYTAPMHYAMLVFAPARCGTRGRPKLDNIRSSLIGFWLEFSEVDMEGIQI